MPIQKKYTKALPCWMTERQHAFLMKAAAHKKLSMSELVRFLIDDARRSGVLDRIKPES